MKFTTICAILSLGIMQMHAQPVITATNFSPKPFDRTISFSCDTTGATDGGSGPNQIWDFSTLSILGITDTLSYFACTDSTQQSTFPDCDVVGVRHVPISSSTLETNFFFFSDRTDSLSLLGAHNPSVSAYPLRLASPQIKMHYPFTYGCSFFSFLYLLGASHYDTSTYDGFGKLILPGLVYDSVVRLHFRSFVTDSFPYYSGPLYFQITSVDSFAWLVPGLHDAVFGISTSTITSAMPHAGDTAYYTTMKKRVTLSKHYSIAGFKGPMQCSSIQVSPNPTLGNVTVSLGLTDLSDVEMLIYDIAGRVVCKQGKEPCNRGKHEICLDLTSEPIGLYFLQVRYNGYTETRKIKVK